MADSVYKIALTGDEIYARLQLLEGDSSAALVNANEVSTKTGKLATQSFVQECVNATKVTITASQNDLEEGATLKSGTLYLVY